MTKSYKLSNICLIKSAPEQLPPFIQEAQKRLLVSASKLLSVCQTHHLIDQEGSRSRYLGDLKVVGRFGYQEFRLHITPRVDDFPSLSIEGRVRETRKRALGLGVDRQLCQERLSIGWISGDGKRIKAGTSEETNLSVVEAKLINYDARYREEKVVDFPKNALPCAGVSLFPWSVLYVGKTGETMMLPRQVRIEFRPDMITKNINNDDIPKTMERLQQGYSQRLEDSGRVLTTMLKTNQVDQEFDPQTFISETIKKIEEICGAAGAKLDQAVSAGSRVLHHS